LGIEEQFYLLWPLVLYFAWRRKYNVLHIVVFLTAASFAANLVLTQPIYRTVAVLLSLLFATLTYQYLELPIRHRRSTFVGPALPACSTRLPIARPRSRDSAFISNDLSRPGLRVRPCIDGQVTGCPSRLPQETLCNHRPGAFT
jgi:peptidoglycan/LPS O-acetylase OafA/YrhL